MGHAFPLKIAPSHGGSGPPSNHRNGISIGWAAFAQLTADCSYSLQWAAPSPHQNFPSDGGSGVQTSHGKGQFPSTFPAVKNDCCDDTLLAVTPRRLAATCDRLLQVSAWLTNMAVYFLIPLAKYQQSWYSAFCYQHNNMLVLFSISFKQVQTTAALLAHWILGYSAYIIVTSLTSNVSHFIPREIPQIFLPSHGIRVIFIPICIGSPPRLLPRPWESRGVHGIAVIPIPV